MEDNRFVMIKILKDIYRQLDLLGQCRRYGVPLRQCPQFLFLVMGAMIVVTMAATYYAGVYFSGDPELSVLIVSFLAGLLLIITFIVAHSFEQLVEANRLKTEFVNIVSHQIRSPLTNLKWIVELMTSGVVGRVGERQAEYFRILKENLERMHSLVSELLTVSRIESTQILFKKEEFSMENLLRGLVEESKPVAKSSNVEINLEAVSGLPTVYSDPFHILQIADNLLINAIRYMGFATDGLAESRVQKRVVIRLYQRGDYLVCEIQDNGIGIPRGEQKYIFQKFFRADNVRRYQANGSGLGLYIAKNTIEKLGGKIGFTSVEGTGSTFWFKIPVKK